MITVEQREVIRRAYYVDHKSIRQIARELHCGRATVDKALLSAAPPAYTVRVPRVAPVLGAYRDRIAFFLRENERLPPKQRYTAQRMYTILRTEGYTGSAVRVRSYVGALKRQQTPPPLFLPLAFDPGQDAQVDWGEAEAVIAGVRQKIQLFVIRLCYSRQTFAMAFPTQRQEAFFEAHVAAFAFFGGVPQRLIYDNLSTAVRKVLTGHTRIEQTAFVTLRSHYLFESRFCTPAQGHEKGGVEHAVGYVRRNFLVPLPDVASFAVLNTFLAAACRADDTRHVSGQAAPIGVLAAQEQPSLRPLPPYPFPCCRTVIAHVTPYSQVVFETNRYSIPVERARTTLTLHVYAFEIVVLDQTAEVTRHPRCYDRDQDIFEPLHYVTLLEQRPGAFDHAKPLRHWRTQWPPVYAQFLARVRHTWPDGRGIQEFVRVLRLHQQHPPEQIVAAVTQALAYGCVHFAGVQLCLRQIQQPLPAITPLDLTAHPHLQEVGTQPIRLHGYEQLLLTLEVSDGNEHLSGELSHPAPLAELCPTLPAGRAGSGARGLEF